jgi:hypothetical protein
VPGAEGAGVREKFVEAWHGPHDLREFLGEPDFPLGQGVVRAGRSARVPREQFLVETGRHGRARKTS